ncbi:ATP-dependent (S)-NAD(P)H-hydrate dehydratase-like [Oscarella lobularis]|uniref:ATP-dependent (S)-NAD(P)H-hydrate dehydratase-like n=1 Tax=Oscarella lobularis TaxID=121494 RepID=UPI0033138691
MATASRDLDLLRHMIRAIVPPMGSHLHKGQAGRIAIVGGSKEYTGAPYYAAMSSLKLGADLSYVFCSEAAATPIKTYSPELIVVPLLDSPSDVGERRATIDSWMSRIHALVVGPGLGRHPDLLKSAAGMIGLAREADKPIVIDADGLHVIGETPALVQDYEKAILTPNAVEFARLYEAVMESPYRDDVATRVENVRRLSERLGHVTIVRKGEEDVVSNGRQVLTCGIPGSIRRCGGQGDVLAGCLGTFVYWANLYWSSTSPSSRDSLVQRYEPMVSAGYAGCTVTRTCSRRAFSRRRRSMTGPDLIAEIQGAYDALFEEAT